MARLEEGERGACVSFGRSDTVESVWCAQQYLFLILKRGKMDGPGDHANSAIEEATKTYVELVAVVRIVKKVLELCLRRFHRHVGFDVAGEDDVEDWLGRIDRIKERCEAVQSELAKSRRGLQIRHLLISEHYRRAMDEMLQEMREDALRFHDLTTSVFERGQMSKEMASKMDDDTDGLIDRMECHSYEIGLVAGCFKIGGSARGGGYVSA